MSGGFDGVVSGSTRLRLDPQERDLDRRIRHAWVLDDRRGNKAASRAAIVVFTEAERDRVHLGAGPRCAAHAIPARPFHERMVATQRGVGKGRGASRPGSSGTRPDLPSRAPGPGPPRAYDKLYIRPGPGWLRSVASSSPRGRLGRGPAASIWRHSRTLAHGGPLAPDRLSRRRAPPTISVPERHRASRVRGTTARLRRPLTPEPLHPARQLYAARPCPCCPSPPEEQHEGEHSGQ